MDVLHPAPPPTFSATSQTTRFHTTDSTSTSKVIDIADISMAIGDRDLLAGGHLQLTAGTRYGLIGRNGVGKSLLLRSLAFRWLPGVPKDVTIFYVDQLEERGAEADMRVMDYVARADAQTAQCLGWIATLEAALRSADATTQRTALLEFETAQMVRQVAKARDEVARTSGARGLANRKELRRLEAALRGLTLPEGDAAGVDATIQGHLSSLYEAVEPEAELQGRAEKVLLSLGFKPAMIQARMQELSGGWRIRVAIAMAVFVEAQVLLLDEPTNHLDIVGILALKKWLATLEDITIVVISHDRAFLDDTVDEIILLQGASLSYFSGNYDTYKQTVEEQKTARAATRDALAKKHDKLQQSITAGRVQARRAGDSKKLVQMASKQKKLEERFGVETNEKGHRFKLNRDRAGYHNTLRDGVQDEHVDAAVVWKLPPPPVLRVPGPLIVIEGVGFAYPGAPGDVLADVSMTVERGSRVALIGKNGEGKTTLVRIMAGELAPRTGSVRVHPAAKVGFLRQNFVDDVRLREASALVDLGARYPAVKEQALYEQLGSFGLQGKTARQPLQSLSGGQAVRYAFACLMMESPHVLLLDEPTNHLDLDTIEALIAALSAYEGAIVAVSHDVFFVQKVANRDSVYTVGGKKATLKGIPGV